AVLESPGGAGRVTLVAELLRRSVAEAAVRPNRVVLPPPPVRLRLRVRRRLKLPAVEELVSQPAVERLDEPILPRAGRGHRARLRARLGQPTAQRLVDDLRAVVAAQPLRRSAAGHDSAQGPPDYLPAYRVSDDQGQALPGVFVHQRQALERSARPRPVEDQV